VIRIELLCILLCELFAAFFTLFSCNLLLQVALRNAVILLVGEAAAIKWIDYEKDTTDRCDVLKI
jgi:hypothetical protein